MKTAPPVYISTTETARRCGCQEHHIRRLFERDFLPEPPRMGKRRLILESDLPKIRKTLALAGYIKVT